MISLETIDAEIIELEKKDTSYAVIERLAWLYIVRDHLTETPVVVSERVVTGAETPFLAAFNGTMISEASEVLNEHFEAIRALYPREYQAVVDRLNQLK